MKETSFKPLFSEADTWVFDLDNTLYPAECNLFAEVDRRMGAFIASLLDVDLEEARRVQKRYYHVYGTTLRGLMNEHNIDPLGFLDYVHEIDLSAVAPDLTLSKAIAELPGRKFILTNGTRAHAEKVARRIGVLELFDDIFDIAAGDFVPKPDPEIYHRFVERFSIAPERAVIFEDLSRNLEAPSALGMITVLVKVAVGPHPDTHKDFRPDDEAGEHVHHVTDDLSGFLADILGTLDGRRQRLT